MRASRVIWGAALVGLMAIPADGGGAIDRGRLASVIARCGRLDRGAYDIVRSVERSDDFDRSRDNTLIADLTAFRAYVRSLREVAEDARDEQIRRRPPLRYRSSVAAMQRLALRLRVTAANVESEIARERSDLLATWSRLARSDLNDLVQTVLGVQPVVTPPPPPPPPPDKGDRPPRGFVRVSARGTYAATGLKGRASHIRIEAYGGDVKVLRVKFTITDVAFSHFTFEYQRELRVNREVVPGQPLLLEVSRRDVVDLSKIEIEWEPDGRHHCFGRVTLVAD